MNQGCGELLLWVDYLRSAKPKCSCLELLDGAKSSMLESAAYSGLGLARAAIHSIRTQVDLLLGFSYFFDHPNEWNQVCTTGNGFMLKSDILKYHLEKPNFKKKLSTIENQNGYSLNNVYRILSSHIHGMSSHTLPKAGHFIELLYSSSFCNSMVQLQKQVTIAVSNFLLVVFLSDPIQAPEKVVIRVKKSLSLAQRKIVFFDD